MGTVQPRTENYQTYVTGKGKYVNMCKQKGLELVLRLWNWAKYDKISYTNIKKNVQKP